MIKTVLVKVFFSSFLPERSVSAVASYCLSRVKEEEGWKTHVDSLCNWRKGNSLLELVVDGIRALIRKEETSSSSKGVRFQEPVSKVSQTRVALRLINYLLEHQINRAILLAKCRPGLEEVMTTCVGVLEYVVTVLGSKDLSGVSLTDVESLVSVYGQLTLLLRPETAVTTTQELMTWSERELLHVLDTDAETRAGATRAHVSLCTRVLASINTIVVSGVSVGLADTDHVDKCLDWSLQLLVDAGVSQLAGNNQSEISIVHY